MTILLAFFDAFGDANFTFLYVLTFFIDVNFIDAWAAKRDGK